MSDTPILFWAQRYQDDYHARAYDPVRNLVSGVRAGDTLEAALHKAASCGMWYVTEWRDEVPDGEQYELINRECDETNLINLLADIRAAAGDPEGKLMQDELVAHIKALLADKVRLTDENAVMRKLIAKLATKAAHPVVLTEALTAYEIGLMAVCARGQLVVDYWVTGVGRELPDRKPKGKLGRLTPQPTPTPQPAPKRHACGNVDGATGQQERRGEG